MPRPYFCHGPAFYPCRMALSKMGFGVGEGGKAAFSYPKFLFAPALGRGFGGGEKQGFRL